MGGKVGKKGKGKGEKAFSNQLLLSTPCPSDKRKGGKGGLKKKKEGGGRF